MPERASSAALALIAVGLSLAALANIPRSPAAVPALPARVVSVRPPSNPTPAAVQALRDGTRVELNAAAASDLELLPGIGPALAERIVSDRQRKGAFSKLDDLRRVRGIGPRTLDRLRSLLYVRPPTGTSDAATPRSARTTATDAPARHVQLSDQRSKSR